MDPELSALPAFGGDRPNEEWLARALKELAGSLLGPAATTSFIKKQLEESEKEGAEASPSAGGRKMTSLLYEALEAVHSAAAAAAAPAATAVQ